MKKEKPVSWCPFAKTSNGRTVCNKECPLWDEISEYCSIKVIASALRDLARDSRKK